MSIFLFSFREEKRESGSEIAELVSDGGGEATIPFPSQRNAREKAHTWCVDDCVCECECVEKYVFLIFFQDYLKQLFKVPFLIFALKSYSERKALCKSKAGGG